MAKKKFITFILTLTTISIVACSGYDEKPISTKPPKTNEKTTNERKEKAAAYRQQVLVENKNIRIGIINENKVTLTIILLTNYKPTMLHYTMKLDGKNEQMDIQDYSANIKEEFKENNLEILAFKFKSGTLDMMAFEYRFTKTTKKNSESASEFVLMYLDKSLGKNAIVKTQFEYPNHTDLQAWTKENIEDEQ